MGSRMVKRAKSPPGRAAPKADADAVFAELRRVFARFASRLVVVSDAPDLYHVNSGARGPDGKPLFFGAVRKGKTYVSFHLMPIYTHPELLDGLDADLRRRLHGKSCFNFKSVDAATTRRLGQLLQRGLETWKRADWA